MTGLIQLRTRRGRWGTSVGALSVAAVLALGTTACGEDSNPDDVRDAVSSVESALNRAGDEFDDFKNGVDAKNQVQVGQTVKDADGRFSVPVTVANTGDKEADFLIQIEFRDASGDMVDTIVMNIDNVAPGQQGDGTARSHVKPAENVTAQVSRALRH
ncbi:hypothetical protein [Streptodolium elevatio]|uniref:Lipoprotein n=1 Tax=Streptodolium elevatio TaxID=3157996 RepID=A0ABV3DIT6_9ACTN